MLKLKKLAFLLPIATLSCAAIPLVSCNEKVEITITLDAGEGAVVVGPETQIHTLKVEKGKTWSEIKNNLPIAKMTDSESKSEFVRWSLNTSGEIIREEYIFDGNETLYAYFQEPVVFETYYVDENYHLWGKLTDDRKVELTPSQWNEIHNKILVPDGSGKLELKEQSEMDSIFQAATTEPTIYLPYGEYRIIASGGNNIGANIIGILDYNDSRKSAIWGYDKSSPDGGVYYATGIQPTFQNIIIEGCQTRGMYRGIIFGGLATYKNCLFYNAMSFYTDIVKCVDCDFDSSEVRTSESSTDYCVYIYGSSYCEFTNCNFYSAGKAIKIYNEGPLIYEGRGGQYYFRNCHFIVEMEIGNTRAGVQVDSEYQGSHTYDLEIYMDKNCSQQGHACEFPEKYEDPNPLYFDEYTMDPNTDFSNLIWID